jgi:hypothetical protein
MPAKPTVTSVGAEGVVLESVSRPTYGALKSGRWYAEYQDASGDWQPLWDQTAVDFRYTKTGDTVRFNGPGLKKGANHRFAVAFCYTHAVTGLTGCDCWSPFSDVYAANSNWSSSAPEAPTGFCQYFEDTFDGPQSGSKYVQGTGQDPTTGIGDGLGPNAIWQDGFPMSTAFNGTYLEGTGEAYFPTNALACLLESPPTQRSYAQAEWRVRDFGGAGNDAYNFDVHGRLVSGGLTAQAYFAKVAYKLRGADYCPELHVGNMQRTTSLNLTKLAGKTMCVGSCGPGPSPPNCDCQIDIGTRLAAGQPVFLRIEMQDINTDPKGVKVIGRVGWDCTDCANPPCDITECAKSCEVFANDTGSVGGFLNGKIGITGIDTHEAEYSVKIFGGGSVPPQAPASCP